MSIQNYIHFSRISKLLDKVAATSFYVFPIDDEERDLVSRLQALNSLNRDIQCAIGKKV